MPRLVAIPSDQRPTRPLRPARRPLSGTIAAIGASRSLEGTTVLVLEDEPDARTMAAEYLAHHGARPVVAADLREALKLLEGIVVDVVVTDIGTLPGSALELVARMDADPRWASIPRVIAADDPERLARMRACARTTYLPRPIPLDRLIESVSIAR